MPAAHHDVTLAYVLLASRPTPEKLRKTAGPGGPLAGFSSLCFLADARRGMDRSSLAGFLEYSAPALLHQLTRRTERERVVLNGRVRGKVDWAATVKARSAEDMSPALFACLQSRRCYDRPENQLFKHLLLETQRSLHGLAPGLRGWRCWGGGHRGGAEPPPLHRHLARLDYRLRSLSQHVHLGQIESPDWIGPEHLDAARRSRNPLYHHVAELYELYRSVVLARDADRWCRQVRTVVPAPPAMTEASVRILTSLIEE
jgi:hypothetical protein